MPKWLQIINKKAEKVTELMIYDQIGEDWFGNPGVEADEFAAALKTVPEDHEIVVAINSPGGNVWDGLAIYNQLQAIRNRVTVRVDGIAASIASIIALAGKELQMPESATFMIHDPSVCAPGTADQLRKVADKLDKHANDLAAIYAKKTKRSVQHMRLLMRAETYMNGAEAKDIGFADTVTEPVKLAACASHLQVLARLNAKQTAIPSGDKTTEKDMKEKLIALLAKLKVKVADDATEEQLFAQLQSALDASPSAELMASIATDLTAVLAEIKAAKLPTPVAAAPPAAPPADIVALQAKLDAIEKKAEAERVLRITNELNAIIADGRPHLVAADWLPRCIADEKLLATLRGIPQIPAGLEPIRAGASDKGNSFLEDYRKMAAGAERNKFRIAHHAELMDLNHRMPVPGQPRAANTIASALVPDYLADAWFTVVWNRLSSVRAYSRDFGVDPMKPRAVVQVRKATTGSAAQTNPTNFETGDTTLTNVAVTVNQISKSFQITNDERNKGHRLAHLAQVNALLFADAISDVVTALMIAGSFGAATVIGAASAFSTSGLPAIFALAKNYLIRNLILDGDYIARLIPLDKFKFDVNLAQQFSAFDGLFMNNKWTGGVANLVGFVCDPRAIAVASGFPESGPPGEFINQGQAESGDLELTVQTNEWFSRGGRVNWASFDVMFGAAVGDGTAAENLVSA